MRRHKYNAKTTTIDGIRFDSKLEARRYKQLKLLADAGVITDLKLQPEFELHPKFVRDGKHYRAVMYRADFGYTEDDRQVVEEIKGHQTALWRLKKKLFLDRYRLHELRILTKEDI